MTLEAVVASSLRGDELIDEVARAKLTLARTQTKTWGEFWFLIFVVRAATYRRKFAKVARRYEEAGFPVAARMLLVLTADRLLVVRASRLSWTPRAVVGSIERSAVTGARFPLVGHGRWKVVEFDLATGSRCRLLIDRDEAAPFLEQLG